MTVNANVCCTPFDLGIWEGHLNIRAHMGIGIRSRLGAALAQVALIFLGITLALAFDTWNAERVERGVERSTLRELRANLVANIAELERNISHDSTTVMGMAGLLEHLDSRSKWSDTLSIDLSQLENWSSPYLTSSAYETLKIRGLDLITNDSLRLAVVELFESSYRYLVDDQDRAEWVNYEVSMVPLMLSRVDESYLGTSPIDYQALLDDGPFRVALHRSGALRVRGINAKEGAVRSTRTLIESIDRYLAN